MTKETIHRAFLIERRFNSFQNPELLLTDEEPRITELYAETGGGIFTLSRDVEQTTNGETIFHHTMTYEKTDGACAKKASLANGEVVRVEGFGDNLSQEDVNLRAKGLFHILRTAQFTPNKPEEV